MILCSSSTSQLLWFTPRNRPSPIVGFGIGGLPCCETSPCLCETPYDLIPKAAPSPHGLAPLALLQHPGTGTDIRPTQAKRGVQRKKTPRIDFGPFRERSRGKAVCKSPPRPKSVRPRGGARLALSTSTLPGVVRTSTEPSSPNHMFSGASSVFCTISLVFALRGRRRDS